VNEFIKLETLEEMPFTMVWKRLLEEDEVTELIIVVVDVFPFTSLVKVLILLEMVFDIGIEEVGIVIEAFIRFREPDIVVLPLSVVVAAVRFPVLVVEAVMFVVNISVKYVVIAPSIFEKKLLEVALVIFALVIVALVIFAVVILVLLIFTLVIVAFVAAKSIMVEVVATKLFIVAVPVAVMLVPLIFPKKRLEMYPVIELNIFENKLEVVAFARLALVIVAFVELRLSRVEVVATKLFIVAVPVAVILVPVAFPNSKLER
jgi:hypothetical protein